MKKTLIKNISLSIVCLLGVGGSIAAASALGNDKLFYVANAAEPAPSASLSGAGTQESPYQIGTASDLIKFRDLVNNGQYDACGILTADIDFPNTGNNWNSPIGNTYPHRYLGVFDGCGYTISGITFNKTNERLYYYGLFGSVGASTIKNVTMKNGSFTVDSMNTGAIVGCIETSGDTLIENCHNVSFDLNFVDATNNSGWVGGIVGKTSSNSTSCNVTIRNCGSTGNITSSGNSTSTDAIGGIVGLDFSKAGDNIINCYNAGTLHNSSNTEDRYPKVGGIIGWARYLSSLRNCHNYGSVSSDKTGNNNVGGVIGNLEKNVSATLSSNYYLNTTYSRPIGTYDGGYSTATFPKALTADEFRNVNSFTGWNFTDLWRMGDLYPELGGTPVQASATGYEGAYDGQPHSISVTVIEPTEGYTITYSTSSTGEYTSVNPTYTEAGVHTTYYKVSADEYVDATGSETVTITKIDPVYEAPTAKTNLAYTGNAQVLINAGTATGGTMLYKLGSGDYSTTVPSATNVGDYTVYYKVIGDANHNDVAEQSFEVTIAKGVISPNVNIANWEFGATPSTPELTGNPGLGDVSYLYKLLDAEESSYSPTVPTAVGAYTIKATVTETTNYLGGTATADFKIAQATPTGYDIPTGLNATYGDTISSVKLPDNWAWKNPNDKVGNAGNREHIAIYTPTDPNYKAVENILTVVVAKANPSVPTLDTIEAPYDVALSTVGLPEGFSWMDGTQKTSSWGENTFKVKYTPSDTVNYNVMENIDVKVNVKWILVDPTQGDVNVTINGDTGEFTVDISIKVEVKTEISMEEKKTEYANIGKEYVKPNEDITAIYDVKLIRTTNGVEEEIQPSEIKEGTTIFVQMAIPEELVGKDFRLLHIHNNNDVSIVENYAVSKDGKTLVVEVDKLSQFAFLGATDKDNGFDYSSGLPGWALALIIIGGILLLGILALLILFIFFPVYYIDYSKREVRRAIYMRTKHGELLMLNTHFVKVRRNEADVYEKKSDALNALNK